MPLLFEVMHKILEKILRSDLNIIDGGGVVNDLLKVVLERLTYERSSVICISAACLSVKTRA
jgi:hypothetical protein